MTYTHHCMATDDPVFTYFLWMKVPLRGKGGEVIHYKWESVEEDRF